MLSKVRQFIAGEQAQAAYEIKNADEIHKIEAEAFERERKQRSAERHQKEAELSEKAKQKAIADAKARGAKKATPVEEQLRENFDEAVAKAIAAGQKAQKFVEAPAVQKKISNVKHNLKNVERDVREIAKPPRQPAKGHRRPVAQKVSVVEKVVREHPVHVRKEKTVVGNPNKGRFGVRSSSREKPTIGNPNKGHFGVKSSKAREGHRFGTRPSRR